jgi:hypothetical protein
VAFQNKYRQYFPNKQTLQLKIREVRQKMMAATMHSPVTPNTAQRAGGGGGAIIGNSQPSSSTADNNHIDYGGAGHQSVVSAPAASSAFKPLNSSSTSSAVFLS